MGNPVDPKMHKKMWYIYHIFVIKKHEELIGEDVFVLSNRII